MMDKAIRMNISDSVERLVFLNDQMSAARQYANFTIIGKADTHVLLKDMYVFDEIRSIYGITEMTILDKRNEDIPAVHYSMNVKGLQFTYIAMKGDDGYDLYKQS